MTADVGLDQREECLPNGWIQVDDALASTAGPTDASQRGLPGAEVSQAGGHSGFPDAGGTGNSSDPAMAERLGLRPYQQTTLTLVEMQQNRPELGCQHSLLTPQPAHARPTNHRAESHNVKICTPLVT